MIHPQMSVLGRIVSNGRIVNSAVTPKPKRETLGFFEWQVVAYWILCATHDLSAFWTGPCDNDWAHCAEQELAKAIATGFWLAFGLIVMSVALCAAFGRRVEP